MRPKNSAPQPLDALCRSNATGRGMHPARMLNLHQAAAQFLPQKKRIKAQTKIIIQAKKWCSAVGSPLQYPNAHDLFGALDSQRSTLLPRKRCERTAPRNEHLKQAKNSFPRVWLLYFDLRSNVWHVRLKGWFSSKWTGLSSSLVLLSAAIHRCGDTTGRLGSCNFAYCWQHALQVDRMQRSIDPMNPMCPTSVPLACWFSLPARLILIAVGRMGSGGGTCQCSLAVIPRSSKNHLTAQACKVSTWLQEIETKVFDSSLDTSKKYYCMALSLCLPWLNGRQAPWTKNGSSLSISCHDVSLHSSSTAHGPTIPGTHQRLSMCCVFPRALERWRFRNPFQWGKKWLDCNDFSDIN